jgi:hypothetical protein
MNDDRLRHLLGDAVSEVEPTDRIDELRASVRPRPRVVPMARHRSWYAGAGIVATAAVIGVVAYLTSLASDQASELGPAGQDTGSPTAIATDTAAVQPHGPGDDTRHAITVYYLGHGGQGDVLVPQPTTLPPGTDALNVALSGLSADPYDPDHRVAWEPGWLVSAHAADGTISVELGSAPSTRPEQMTARTAYESVQAAVYTLQEAARGHAPVRFLRHGQPAATVLGVPTAQAVTADRAWDTVSPVAITKPAVERDRLRRGTTVVTGIGTAPSGSVIRIQVVRGSARHRTVVLQKTVRVPPPVRTDQVATWRTTFDTRHLAPGRYTLRASTTGFSGGQAATDTRVVVLR